MFPTRVCAKASHTRTSGLGVGSRVWGEDGSEVIFLQIPHLSQHHVARKILTAVGAEAPPSPHAGPLGAAPGSPLRLRQAAPHPPLSILLVILVCLCFHVNLSITSSSIKTCPLEFLLGSS